ncbi:hypothetical protein [Sulfurovum sp. NBC37-1]|uniref:hypothetical protein n=1 Tax=Sulfurovum sp. (strain NBC37-1) TaxID=387093 RepID=UPI0001587C1E|nr:hypothetical protein [Sulfurovum sp. NBC37-1]BAF73107.1 conserved hypothetical protein [Sulfurovum sp. NBC37-1]
MRTLFTTLLILIVTVTFSPATMKCGPGKCGSAMKMPEGKKVFKGNTARQPIDITPKTYQCSQCNMFVNDPDYAAELITNEGMTYFFDDIGCLVKWIQKHSSADSKMFVRSLDTHRWVDARKAWYSRTDSTPMHYGFGAYEKKTKDLISFQTMESLILKGKTLRDPAVKKLLLQP